MSLMKAVLHVVGWCLWWRQ